MTISTGDFLNRKLLKLTLDGNLLIPRSMDRLWPFSAGQTSQNSSRGMAEIAPKSALLHPHTQMMPLRQTLPLFLFSE